VSREDDRRSTTGMDERGGWAEMDFLDKIEPEERDEELEAKMGEDKKRKRGEDDFKGRGTGLRGLPGWERKSNAMKDSERWKRKVVRVEKTAEGEFVRKESVEKIPTPDGFDLGREGKGLEMNNSGRLKNNFGTNREALFSAGAGKKTEMRNWIASFTKAGCVSCRDENGHLNHKGRDGQPSVLIVGDEATPTTVGYTGKDRNEGRGDSCAWVLKVEHLGLDEVCKVLQKINQEKRVADRESGKREHDFFLSNGSKILVSSYTHLRKEGIEGYIRDFNQMVKNAQGVVGRADIEILPVVPVVREGVDKVGRLLLSMVGEWIDWIGVTSERESVRRLSGTGGREFDKLDEGSTFIWRPTFLMKVVNGTAGKVGEVRMIEGVTTETVVRAACVTSELEKLRGGERAKENAKKTTCEKEGLSMEGEFVFSRAVGEFFG
jgi:hypothetical protein